MASDPFATTHWSIVVAARDASSAAARQALDRLARTYWRPLNEYVRRRGYSPQDADDLTQSFFARFIEKNYLQTVSSEKGRFRAFLLAAINHFLADEYDKRQAQKRGGAQRFVTLSALDHEAPKNCPLNAHADSDAAYDRAWAIATLDEALVRVGRRYAHEGKQALFERLKPRLSGDDSRSYAEIAAALDMDEGAIRTAAHRLRRRYKQALQEVVVETLDSSDLLQDELQVLLSALG